MHTDTCVLVKLSMHAKGGQVCKRTHARMVVCAQRRTPSCACIHRHHPDVLKTFSFEHRRTHMHIHAHRHMVINFCVDAPHRHRFSQHKAFPTQGHAHSHSQAEMCSKEKGLFRVCWLLTCKSFQLPLQSLDSSGPRLSRGLCRYIREGV